MQSVPAAGQRELWLPGCTCGAKPSRSEQEAWARRSGRRSHSHCSTTRQQSLWSPRARRWGYSTGCCSSASCCTWSLPGATEAHTFRPSDSCFSISSAGIHGWVFGIKKNYQDIDTSLQSSVITKVKGVAHTNTTLLGERVWDVADFVVQSQGGNTFIVITNLILTLNQRQGTCAEREGIPDGECSQDDDCPAGESVIAGHGLKTGRCLQVGNSTRGTCEIFAWCPVEKVTTPVRPILKDAEDFTIFIKNFVHFPKFNFSKANVLETANKTFLKTCHFSPKNLYCPIFRLGTIISWAGSNYEDIALKGGVIGVYIEWDCDLDQSASNCNPHYYFNRLDSKQSQPIHSGYNFRFARYYRDPNGKEFRDLIKAYGILFDVIVYGKAGKFSIIPTIINLGTGFALMSAGAFLCDMILIYLIRKRGFYRDKKFEKVSRHKDETKDEKLDVSSEKVDQGLEDDEPPEGTQQEEQPQPRSSAHPGAAGNTSEGDLGSSNPTGLASRTPW